MQDLDGFKKTLTDSGLLSSDEAIALLRILAGEQITEKMLKSLPSAVGKLVPTLIQKLVDDHEQLLDKSQKLEQKLGTKEGLTEDSREVFRKITSGEQPSEEEIARLPGQQRTLVRAHLQLEDEAKRVRAEMSQMKKDIEKITYYVKSVRAEDDQLDQYEVAESLLPLANAVVALADTVTEKVRNKFIIAVEEGLKTGVYGELGNEVIDSVNKLVVRKLDEVLKPYEDLSRQYVAGEITHEEFTEALKKNALLDHMREQVVSDVLLAVEEGRIDAPEVPPKLRNAIQNLVRNAHNGVPLAQQEAPTHRVPEPQTPPTPPTPATTPAPVAESPSALF